MKKVLVITLFAAVAWCTGTAVGLAQPAIDNASTVTINVNVNSHARLTLDGNQGAAIVVTFNDADPEATPTLTAAPIAVSARGRTSSGSTITLTVEANQVLTSGTDTIALSNITWGANGNLLAGALDTAPVTICSWVGSGTRGGNHTYVLANSWSYATGSYTTTVTYTLTVP